MITFRIAVFPGDGIGQEVMNPCLELLEMAARKVGGFELQTEWYEAGADLYRRTGVALPDESLAAAADADAILLGAMGLPDVRYPDGTEVQPHLDLRERFKLYAGMRPLRFMRGTPSPLSDPRAQTLDAVLVRESTEGIFASRTMTRSEGDAVIGTIRISRDVSERLFHFAFRLARTRAAARGRPARLTCVDKANVIPSLAFFRTIFLEVAQSYQDVSADCIYVDAAGLHLIRSPWEFDVLVTENMFGDILSDIGAALIGGMGMAPSADVGDDHAIFQPCHGTAPDIAGRGLANPTAMILSGAMMLDWLGQKHGVQSCIVASKLLTHSVEAAFAPGDLVSYENGGNAGMAFITEQVRASLRRSESLMAL
jgi:3-isopropylmalate dehydrogenase